LPGKDAGVIADTAQLIASLQAIVGLEYVLSGERSEPYARDRSFLVASCVCVAFPSNTQEVSAILRLCHRLGVSVVARGSGTGEEGGAVPLSGSLVLSLERLKDLDIDRANLVAVAGAGVITLDLQNAAASHGLLYPPDPGSTSICSIGGNVSTNAGGMVSVRYGVTADYVLGMTVVLADGTVLRLGGRTRKRSSGYRLHQLFIGSEGTLGVVTEVILKLIPRPRHRATALIGYASVDDAGAAVSRLLQAGHVPVAIEIIDRSALALIKHHLPADFSRDFEAVLIVENDGNDKDEVDRSLAAFVQVLGGVDNRIAHSELERQGIWNARRSVGDELQGMAKNFFGGDVVVPIGLVSEMIRRIQRVSAESGLEIATFGHAGDGNLHPAIIFTDEQRPLVGRAAAQIFRDALELGGSLSAEHGLGAVKRDFAEEEHGPQAMALMRTIKKAMDPLGILNPQKVFPQAPDDDDFLARQPGWGVTPDGGIEDRSEFRAEGSPH
jgi:glycolate oxidase